MNARDADYPPGQSVLGELSSVKICSNVPAQASLFVKKSDERLKIFFMVAGIEECSNSEFGYGPFGLFTTALQPKIRRSTWIPQLSKFSPECEISNTAGKKNIKWKRRCTNNFSNSNACEWVDTDSSWPSLRRLGSEIDGKCLIKIIEIRGQELGQMEVLVLAI